jgi:hypothetical protein
MDANRFDAISRMFASRRLSRRGAVKGASAGLAGGMLAGAGLSMTSAQEATPLIPEEGHGPTTLFLQSFRQGSIAPKDGEDGMYTVTLEQGLGQTIYFSDRPDRTVGASPTAQLLQTLGFPDDNPPNAALVVDIGEGDTDIAVVELFAPVYDETTHTATYDVKVLAAWADTMEVGFHEEPADLAMLPSTFGSAHLFIDDCPDATMHCKDRATDRVIGEIPNANHDGYCYSYFNVACLPCAPAWDYQGGGNSSYWRGQCAERFEECRDDACYLTNFCSSDAPLGNTLCRGME